VPQKKGWFFWTDIILPKSCGTYDSIFLGYIASERGCTDFLNRLIEREQRDASVESYDKEFAKNHLTYYIELGDDHV